MAFRSVGINLSGGHPAGEESLAAELRVLAEAGPDSVEVGPHGLGAILGGKLDEARVEDLKKTLAEAGREGGFGYTVHAPHALNLMDPGNVELQRAVLEASVLFAGRIGAGVVVCHAGKREKAHARYSLEEGLAAEEEALRRAGDLAAGLGVALAVENSYPEPPILRGETLAPAAKPSGLAARITAVDHPAVGACLDVGHAAVAATFFGLDYLRECAAVAPHVRHVHLHDNLGRPEPEGGEPRAAERLAYGIGDLHLPPGRGTIPLEELLRTTEFPQNPTACVELPASLRPRAKEAVEAARKLGGLVGVDA